MASISWNSSTDTSITVYLSNLSSSYTASTRLASWYIKVHNGTSGYPSTPNLTKTIRNGYTTSETYTISGLTPSTSYDVKCIISNIQGSSDQTVERTGGDIITKFQITSLYADTPSEGSNSVTIRYAFSRNETINNDYTVKLTIDGADTYNLSTSYNSGYKNVSVSYYGTHTAILMVTHSIGNLSTSKSCGFTTTQGATWVRSDLSLGTVTSNYQSNFSISAYQLYRCEVTFSVSGTVKIYTTGSFDTLGYLSETAGWDSSSGTPTAYLKRNDDGGNGYNFSISYSVTANTTYYIWLRSSDETKSGSTILHIEPPPVWYLTEGSAGLVTRPFQRVINLASLQLHKISATFSVSGEAKFYTTGSVDTRGYLSTAEEWNNSTGIPTYDEWDDDEGDDNNFLFTYNVTANIPYYIWVRGYDKNTSGSTNLVIEPPVNYDLTPTSCTVTRINGGLKATISGATDATSYGFKVVRNYDNVSTTKNGSSPISITGLMYGVAYSTYYRGNRGTTYGDWIFKETVITSPIGCTLSTPTVTNTSITVKATLNSATDRGNYTGIRLRLFRSTDTNNPIENQDFSLSGSTYNTGDKTYNNLSAGTYIIKADTYYVIDGTRIYSDTVAEKTATIYNLTPTSCTVTRIDTGIKATIDGGSDAENYTLKAVRNWGTSPPSYEAVSNNNSDPVQIIGLEYGTTYHIYCRGNRDTQSSEWFDAGNITTAPIQPKIDMCSSSRRTITANASLKSTTNVGNCTAIRINLYKNNGTRYVLVPGKGASFSMEGHTSTGDYQMDGLALGTYIVEAYSYLTIDGTDIQCVDSNGSLYSDWSEPITISEQRPDPFQWTTPKVQNEHYKNTNNIIVRYPITVDEWNGLTQNINAVRAYKGLNIYPFTPAELNKRITADMYNEARQAIQEIDGSGTLIPQVMKNVTEISDYALNIIVTEVNIIPE